MTPKQRPRRVCKPERRTHHAVLRDRALLLQRLGAFFRDQAALFLLALVEGGPGPVDLVAAQDLAGAREEVLLLLVDMVLVLLAQLAELLQLGAFAHVCLIEILEQVVQFLVLVHRVAGHVLAPGLFDHAGVEGLFLGCRVAFDMGIEVLPRVPAVLAVIRGVLDPVQQCAVCVVIALDRGEDVGLCGIP